MASQTEKDTARARARTQADTARAQGQTSSRNAQTQADTERARARTQADTARAKSRQNGGDGGTGERMLQREFDILQRGSEIAEAAGIDEYMKIGDSVYPPGFEDGFVSRSVLGSNDPFYIFERDVLSEEIVDHGVHDQGEDVMPAPVSSFEAIVCVNGRPFAASIQGIIGNEIVDE